MAKYKRQTYDVWEVQGYYDGEWSMLVEEITMRNALHAHNEYEVNEPRVPHRIVKRRVKYAN